ncbi:MAG: serine/threonine-protein kinase [Pseudomonadota bacterium]
MLTEEQYKLIESLVDEVLDQPQERRAARLAEIGRASPQLPPHIEWSLAWDARLERTDFMAKTADAEGAADSIPPARSTVVPDQIGQYQILRHLGAGGMGTVYLAQQQEPIKRRVALKVTHAFDTERDRARFALEAQAMASMQHPNSASLYDSGTTGEGTPYVAMELVEEARSLIMWCDDSRASIELRLNLFLQVCAGVAYAHDKGVLHRDIKPANLLIAEVDSEPVAKGIDFGIARAFSNPMRGIVSQASIAGSPVYMSPEALGASEQRSSTPEATSTPSAWCCASWSVGSCPSTAATRSAHWSNACAAVDLSVQRLAISAA